MATPVFSITAAYIVGLAVQCSFYGLALATFFLCVRALCALPFSAFPRSRWALLAVSTAMILVGTLSVGQAIAHNLVAFVYYKDGLAAQEELLLNQDPAIWIHVRCHSRHSPRVAHYPIQSITYPVQGFLGDSVLVYRTWIVNSYDWRFIAFPVLLVIGSAVSGWGIVASVGSGTIGAYLNKSVVPWTDAFLVTSITLNVLCTGMIIWRIISVRGRSSGLQLVQRVVIESGFLYTLTSLLFLITNLMKSASVYVVADAVRRIFSPLRIRSLKILTVSPNHPYLLQHDHHPHIEYPRRLRRPLQPHTRGVVVRWRGRRALNPPRAAQHLRSLGALLPQHIRAGGRQAWHPHARPRALRCRHGKLVGHAAPLV
jgi:hypothetical protein